jgi:ABC-type amino acid transport substrate-binding protein
MKKFALVSLIVLAALALTACGGGGADKVQVATWPPFICRRDLEGDVGFDIDLLNAIAAETGLESVVNVSWDHPGGHGGMHVRRDLSRGHHRRAQAAAPVHG